MNAIERFVARQAERITGAKITSRDRIGEALEVEHLSRLLKYLSVDCVFDVGANEGQYANMLRRDVGYEGLIISFEPIPELASRLREMASNDANWLVYEIALGDQTGFSDFQVMQASQFSSLLKPLHTEAADFAGKNIVLRQIRVKMERIESLFDTINERRRFSSPFLKMDTQGNDFAVVEGAGGTIKTFVGIQSELSIKRLYRGSKRFDEVISMYLEKGFELSALVHNHPYQFPKLIEVDGLFYRPLSEC